MTPHGKFNVRVGYLAFNKGNVLLQYSTRNKFWFVPGGRVGFGNSTHEAVIREVYEELSLKIDDVEIAGMVEKFITSDEYNFHEICIYYRISVPEGFVLPKEEINGDPVTFAWHSIDQMISLDIRPSFLKRNISHFHKGFTHCIHEGD